MADAVRDAERDNEGGADGYAYKITSPIELAQLNAELCEAFGWNDAQLNLEGTPVEASDAEPVELWTGHMDASEQLMLTTLHAHVPDPDYFKPDVEYVDITIEEVKAKAAEGGVLDSDEIQVALRHLLAADEG